MNEWRQNKTLRLTSKTISHGWHQYTLRRLEIVQYSCSPFWIPVHDLLLFFIPGLSNYFPIYFYLVLHYLSSFVFLFVCIIIMILLPFCEFIFVVTKNNFCKHLPWLETLWPAANKVINNTTIGIVLFSSSREFEATCLSFQLFSATGSTKY